MQMQIIFVAGIGILGILIIVGAILLLNKEESPAQRDKKVKNQIMAEMLEAATTDEERQRIMDMMDADQLDEAFGTNEDFLTPKEEKNLYGIDTESGDMLDIIIAKQLQQAASDEQNAMEADAETYSSQENTEYKSELFAYDNIDNLEETMVIERNELLTDDKEEIAAEIVIEPMEEQSIFEESAEENDEEDSAAEGEDNDEGENNPS